MAPSARFERLVERNLLVYRRTWMVLLSGFFEPLFYLLGIGFGIGALVGPVSGPGGNLIPYRVFVAPALLASSAMNGAIYDSTTNVFFKLKYAHTYMTPSSRPRSACPTWRWGKSPGPSSGAPCTPSASWGSCWC